MTFNTLPEFLEHWADERGDKIWLRDLREEHGELMAAQPAKKGGRKKGGSMRPKRRGSRTGGNRGGGRRRR